MKKASNEITLNGKISKQNHKLNCFCPFAGWHGNPHVLDWQGGQPGIL